jgi:hypothetical protein
MGVMRFRAPGASAGTEAVDTPQSPGVSVGGGSEPPLLALVLAGRGPRPSARERQQNMP